MTRGHIVVAGSLAQRPGYGGHAWVFLQYLLGFRRLGYDVLFLDWLDETMCSGAGRPCAAEDSWNLQYLADVMHCAGLGDAWSVNYNQGARTFGVPREKVLSMTKDATLLLNVMGFLADGEILGRVRRRVFLDIDPGFGQMWQELGLATVFGGHDVHLTIGENVGQPECEIPTCGLKWISTPQPVVLERWPVTPTPDHPHFSSIVSWRGPFGPVEYAGKTYGLRVHEFRKFITLPTITGQRFDLALDIAASELLDLALLWEHRWNLLEPRKVVSTPADYQTFIQQSGAELMVAKNMYVESRSGWISDRSICYLASGKPVLAQDTGIGRRYPVGEGLITFQTLDEARAGVEEISGNYARHCRAARAVVEEHFDSDKVLTRLLEKIG